MKRFLLLFLPVLLFALPGLAASKLGSSYGIPGFGVTYEMCDAEAESGVCDNASSVDVYADVGGMRGFTATFVETGSGNECHLYIGDQELAAALPASLSGVGQQITTLPLSASTPVFEWDYPTFLVWADCTFAAGTFSLNIQAMK